MFRRKKASSPRAGVPYRSSARVDAPPPARRDLARQVLGAAVAMALIAATLVACLLGVLAVLLGATNALDGLSAW